MSQPSLATKFFIQILKKAKHGSIRVTFPDGKIEGYGEGPFISNIEVKNWSAIDDIVNKGDIGLAEAVTRGEIIVDQLAALVEWACLNDHSLAQALHGTWYGTLLYKLKHLLKSNSKNRAKKNIMAHYDLGNDFYKLWLDPSMTYSSALYNSGTENLENAQMNKYDRLIEQLDIRSEDHVLEIGCGWGGFFSRAIEKTGCRVTAVMNSPKQATYNRELIEKKGLAGHVDLKEMDYRDIEGRYDKIVSIEMIEAVGEQYWNQYFQKIANSLRAKGSALIQGITIRDDLFYSYRQKTDFIQNYIFPGGMLLANSIFDKQSKENGMKLSDQFEFGLSYAKTLANWRTRFHEVRDQLDSMGFDESFIRMWDLYFCYCEGAFRAQRINVGQYMIVK